MKLIQRFKTITFNIVATAAAWLATTYGIEMSEEHQMAITTTIMAAANVAISIFTGSPKSPKSKQPGNE